MRIPAVQSIGDLVPRSGIFHIHMRFERSLFLFSAKTKNGFFIVTPDIGAGPLNIVVASLHPFAGMESFHPAAFPAAAPPYNSAAPHLDDAAMKHLHASLTRHLPGLAPEDSLCHLSSETPLARRFQQGRAALAAHRYTAAARLLAGLGPGLTPSGDDYLSGCLLALHLQGNTRAAAHLRRAIHTTNPVSNLFLHLARQGRVNAPLKALLAAPAGCGIRQRIAAVCAFGHTSGADLLTGLREGFTFR